MWLCPVVHPLSVVTVGLRVVSLISVERVTGIRGRGNQSPARDVYPRYITLAGVYTEWYPLSLLQEVYNRTHTYYLGYANAKRNTCLLSSVKSPLNSPASSQIQLHSFTTLNQPSAQKSPHLEGPRGRPTPYRGLLVADMGGYEACSSTVAKIATEIFTGAPEICTIVPSDW